MDGFPAEIKTVESIGRWAICSKLYQSLKQGADYLILRFPIKEMYSQKRIDDGWQLYEKECSKRGIEPKEIIITVVVDEQEPEIIKKPLR